VLAAVLRAPDANCYRRDRNLPVLCREASKANSFRSTIFPQF